MCVSTPRGAQADMLAEVEDLRASIQGAIDQYAATLSGEESLAVMEKLRVNYTQYSIVVTPIRQLDAIIQEIQSGNGDLTERVHVKNKDEINCFL